MMEKPQNLNLSRYEYAGRIVRELKSLLPTPVVYDVGAGKCLMREPVEAAGLEWRGFDAFPESGAVQRWNLDEPCPARVVAAGMVLLLDVIEHLQNPGSALRHAASVLALGGRLLITTPNPRWSRSRTHALRTGFLGCFTQADLDLNGHVFPIWPHVLEKMLKDAGFVVESYVTLDGPTRWPGPPLNLRYLLRLMRAVVNKWIEYRDATACGMSFAVVARRDGVER